jgi:nicotinamide riboside transporter PnuC
MELTVFTWLLVAAALIGTWLNVKQDRRCFYIWAVTNAGLCGVNAISGQWAQALLFAVYFALALVGVRQWQRRQQAGVRVVIRKDGRKV